MFSSDLLRFAQISYITIHILISFQNHYGGLNSAYDKAIKHFNFNESMADLMVRCTILIIINIFGIINVWKALNI